MSRILVAAEVYERKALLGGGFRGIAADLAEKRRLDGEVRPTLEEARNDAKRLAHRLLAGRLYRPGYVWGKRSWRCNYWGSP